MKHTEMIANPERTFAQLAPRNGVLALRGYGLRIAVERGHLVVEDGIAADRRRGRFSRIGSDLRRLVVLGHTGSVTLDALRWLQDVGCAFLHLDADGRLITVGTAVGRDDATLRRAQALASRTATGVEIARTMIQAKLDGQANVLAGALRATELAEAVRAAATSIEDADRLDGILYVESRAAASYWGQWRDVRVHFAGKTAGRVPAHWHTVGARRSVLTGRNQRAVNPANAILNYLYSIGEAEARIALFGAGLDPGIGIWHVDRMNRDSMALDVLEPVRPEIEAFVLRMLASRTFVPGDFFEGRDGSCRLMPSVTADLAATAPQWARAFALIVSRAVRLLERSSLMQEAPAGEPSAPRAMLALPRLLQLNPYTPTLTSKRGPRRAPHEAPATDRRCRQCGEVFAHSRNAYCDACKPCAVGFAAARAHREAERWVMPTKTRQLIGHARTERLTQMRAWAACHAVTPNPQLFVKTIWPTLSGVDASAMRHTTGLSRSYCKRILLGRAVPHPMHWEAIRLLSHPTPARNKRARSQL